MIDNIKEEYEAELETLLLMIKSEHPCEFLAVDQLADELILINEHNISSPNLMYFFLTSSPLYNKINLLLLALLLVSCHSKLF